MFDCLNTITVPNNAKASLMYAKARFAIDEQLARETDALAEIAKGNAALAKNKAKTLVEKGKAMRQEIIAALDGKVELKNQKRIVVFGDGSTARF